MSHLLLFSRLCSFLTFYVQFWHCSVLRLCGLAIKTTKNHHRTLKWVWHRLDLILLFRAYIKISNKIFQYIFENFQYISTFFKVLFTFYNLCTPKSTGKSSQISESGVASSKFNFIVQNTCSISFVKLLVKFCFVIFANIFKGMLSLNDVLAQKTTTNCHMSLKWMWYPSNFLTLFRIYIKISEKFVS